MRALWKMLSTWLCGWMGHAWEVEDDAPYTAHCGLCGKPDPRNEG